MNDAKAYKAKNVKDLQSLLAQKFKTIYSFQNIQQIFSRIFQTVRQYSRFSRRNFDNSLQIAKPPKP